MKKKSLLKRLRIPSNIDDIEIRAITAFKQLYFRKNNFFRTPSCLEQLFLSNNYFLVANTFSSQLLLEGKYFFNVASALEELLLQFRLSSYSEQVLFRNMDFFQTASFSEELILGVGIFREQLLFLKCYFCVTNFNAFILLKKLFINHQSFF